MVDEVGDVILSGTAKLEILEMLAEIARMVESDELGAVVLVTDVPGVDITFGDRPGLCAAYVGLDRARLALLKYL